MTQTGCTYRDDDGVDVRNVVDFARWLCVAFWADELTGRASIAEDRVEEDPCTARARCARRQLDEETGVTEPSGFDLVLALALAPIWFPHWEMFVQVFWD